MTERRDDSASATWLTTPRAVLIGLVGAGALIGFGLQQGMKREAPVVAPSATTSATLPAPTPRRQPDPGSVASAAPAAEVREKAIADARAALDARRSDMKKACPEFATGEPSKVTWNFTFDAAGKQLTRGVLEDRDHSRPGVANCISRDLPPLSIPPPGTSVYIEVPFDFP